MIGREDERTLLEHAFELAVRERSCHLFTIFGAAGVGKSRLVAEVVATLFPTARRSSPATASHMARESPSGRSRRF